MRRDISTADFPYFTFNGVHFIGMHIRFTEESHRWIMNKIRSFQNARVALVGLQPTSNIVRLVREINMCGCTVVQVMHTGDFERLHVESLEKECKNVHIAKWELRGSLVDWMEQAPRLLRSRIDCVLFLNTQRGLLYALRRIGVTYPEMQKDIQNFGKWVDKELSPTGRLLDNAYRLMVPAYSFYPGEHVAARSKLYAEFSDGLAHSDLESLHQATGELVHQARRNAHILGTATEVDARSRIAFVDMEAHFVDRRPVDIEAWQSAVLREHGPVLLCSTGGGRTKRRDGPLEPVVIVVLPHAWREKVDLAKIAGGKFEGYGNLQPEHIRLAKNDFERFRLVWAQERPALTR